MNDTAWASTHQSTAARSRSAVDAMPNRPPKRSDHRACTTGRVPRKERL